MSTIFQKYKYYIFLSTFLWVILFIISPDSYTHLLFDRDDSAIFFTSGKALMNGLTPYVDFADSKGPLLWLIYGIGYLISHYDYTGVFWLSWIAYSITFAFIFRISRIFLEDNNLSFISSVAMIMFVFYPWFHYEVKSEDWCQPFVAATLYHTCRLIYNDLQCGNDVKRAFLTFGISFSACLMIKFGIAAMLSSIFIYLLFYKIKKGQYILFPILWSALGAFIIILPFIFYLFYIDAFYAFINEYFIKTLMTIDNSNYHTNYIHEILYHICRADRVLYFFTSLVGCVGIWFIKRRAALFLPFVLFMFWALSSRHADSHYFNACTLLSVFFVICIVYTYRLSIKQYEILATIATMTFTFFFTVITNSFIKGYLNPTFIMVKSQYRNDIEQVYKITSKINTPRIIFYNSLDRGDGIKANALPGSVYWTSQKGASTEMVQRQISDIRAHKADFIITEAIDSITFLKQVNYLKSLGYFEVYRFKSPDKWGLKRSLLQ